MQVHYDEGIAIHIGPEPCAGLREDICEASVGGHTGQPLSRERMFSRAPTLSTERKATRTGAQSQASAWPGVVADRHVWKLLVREPGDLRVGHDLLGGVWSAAGRRGAIAADARHGEV